MPTWLLKTKNFCARFLSNSSYAVWFQNLVIIVSVIVAFLALRDTNRNISVSNAIAFSQKYYLDRPATSNMALILRTAQYSIIQDAKSTIVNYNKDTDREWDRLFATARPLVEKKITDNQQLIDNYEQVESFFSSVILCTSTGVCDRNTVRDMLADEMLGFYNAVCPYMDRVSSQDNNDDISKRVVSFLVNTAHVSAPRSYFCRDKLALVLAAKK